MDQKHWFAVGQGTGYLRCDYSRWGSQKKMLDPFLKQLPDGGWLCTWKLNTHDGYGQAKSKDLVYWESQKYPQVTSDFEGTRVKVTIDGQEQTGNINRVSWTLVDKLTKHYERNQYRNVLHAERPVQDKERFAGLKPVKATITVQPEETKEISNLLLGIFFEDINYSADGGLYAELIQNRDFEYDPSDREGDKNWNSTHSWKLEGDNATFTINTSDPVHPNNPHYAVLNIQQPGAVLTNAGFDGIALQAGEKYDFSLFGRIPAGHKSNKLQVRLIDSNGTVQGEASITVSSRSWKTYKTVLTAKTAADTHLELQLQSVGEVELDMISLFPQNTFKGRKNGLRADLVKNIIGIGVSPFLMNVCACMVVIFINNRLVDYGGDLAVGAYGIAYGIAMMFVMFVIGLNQGMQPIAGYNYGSQQIDRLMRVLKLSIIGATCIMVLGWSIGMFCPELVARMFTTDENLIRHSANAMRIVMLVFPIIGYQMVVTNFFQCIGKVKISIFLSLSRQLIILLPMLGILPLFFGLNGVWAAMPVSDASAAVIAAVVMFVFMRKFKLKATSQNNG